MNGQSLKACFSIVSTLSGILISCKKIQFKKAFSFIVFKSFGRINSLHAKLLNAPSDISFTFPKIIISVKNTSSPDGILAANASFPIFLKTCLDDHKCP